MPDLIGHTLGQYRIVEQIGLGGMATVYKAFQPALDRYVAIKVLPAYYAHEPGFAKRFIREAKAVAKLTHPHVLPIYDFGQEDNQSYIVMQYVGAGTLKDMLGQPISLVATADIVEQIADALDYAHDQGIIHRDVKPSNVLMDRGRWVMLSDFGLAKMVEGSVQLTGSGVGVGTPTYMAPEQGQGLKVDQRADVYSLGVILYEMVTGRVPFEAETPMAIVVKHITESLPLPRKINPDLPESVERIILKALAKSTDDRYETAGKMAKALRKAVAGLDTAVAEAVPSPPPVAAEAIEAPTVLEEGGATRVVPPPVPAPAPKRKGLPIWAVVLGGVLLLLLLMISLRMMRAVRDRRAARATAAVAVETPVDIGGEATPLPTEPLPPKTPRPGPADSSVEEALIFIEHNPPIFRDDFEDPGSGWRIDNDQHGRQGDYEDGSYVVRVPEIVGEENIAGVPLPIERPPIDFVLQMDLVRMEGGPGATWDISFRLQPDGNLYVGLGGQPPHFGIGFFSPDKEMSLAEGPARNYNSFEVTQVTLVVIGPDIALYLDGEQVGTARTDLIRPGDLRFGVLNGGDPMVAYRFDNVRVWDLTPMSDQTGAGGKPLLFEDFEDGRADGWELGAGWNVVQEEDGNHALQAEEAGWALLEGSEWGDIHLHFRVKPLDGGLFLFFRGDPAHPGGTSYLAHLMPDGIVLHRREAEHSQMVTENLEVVYTVGDWHEIDLIAVEERIEIIVNGESVLTYDDPDPLGPGIIGFENGDPPVRYLIDDVVVEQVRP
jgi:hypothetical protein